MTSDAIPETWQEQNELSHGAWQANSAFWDQRIGDEGNPTFAEQLWPAIQKLLEPNPGQRLIDAACGNGVLARRLAGLGAEVVAFDFAAELLTLARSRPLASRIDYRLLDATDAAALRTLGAASFDGLTCSMGLMDMPLIDPLIEAGLELLKPGSPFVFSVVHPCFNTVFASIVAERLTESGRSVVRHSLRLTDYAGAAPVLGEAIRGQPQPQPYFDRTLESLLGAFFRAGYVMDGINEPLSLERPDSEGRPTWSNLSGIPQSLVVRMRTPRV